MEMLNSTGECSMTEESDDDILTWRQEIQLLKQCEIDDGHDDKVDGDAISSLIQLDYNVIGQMKPDDIVSSCENVILLNQAIQALLRKIEQSIRARLQSNREQQATLQKVLKNSSNPNYFQSYKCCCIPYFKVPSGWLPPRNSETKLQILFGHASPLDFIQTPYFWTQRDGKLLRALVTNVGRERHLAKMKENVDRIVRSGGDLDALEKAKEQLNNSKVDYSVVDWDRVAASLNGSVDFLPSECLARWSYVEAPHINHKSWSEDEVSRLLHVARENLFQNWQKISTALGSNRSELQCCIKFQVNQLVQPGPFLPDQKKKLKDLITTHSIGNFIPWNKIHYFFETRNIRSLQDYHSRSCLPKKLGRFDAREDSTLISLSKAYKGDIRAVQKHFPGRTRLCLTRRLNILLKSHDFTPEEEELLVQGYRDHGGNWNTIVELLPGRNIRELKARYETLSKSIVIKEKLASRYGRPLNNIPATLNDDVAFDYLKRSSNIEQGCYLPVTSDGLLCLALQDLLRMFEHSDRAPFKCSQYSLLRTPENVKTFLRRMCFLAAALKYTPAFEAMSLRLNDEPHLHHLKESLKTIAAQQLLHLPPVLTRIFVPPNDQTLLGLRSMISQKITLRNQTAILPPVPTARAESLPECERLTSLQAKDLLRARMFNLFFLSFCVSKLERDSVESSICPKKKPEKVKKMPRSKRRLKKHLRTIKIARWSKNQETEELHNDGDASASDTSLTETSNRNHVVSLLDPFEAVERNRVGNQTRDDETERSDFAAWKKPVKVKKTPPRSKARRNQHLRIISMYRRGKINKNEISESARKESPPVCPKMIRVTKNTQGKHVVSIPKPFEEASTMECSPQSTSRLKRGRRIIESDSSTEILVETKNKRTKNLKLN